MYFYKKSAAVLLMVQGILLLAWISVREAEINHIASTPAFQIRFMEDHACLDGIDVEGTAVQVSSEQRVVDFTMLEREMAYAISEDDYEVLLRIVEAEAGGEDIKGRMLVAGVILNRVESSKFPDTVREVVFQKENGVAQFSPTVDGRYDRVRVSMETTEAVDRVLYGENLTEGALYFAARKHADPERMKWFDSRLTLLFSYGGHEFFS